MPTLNLIGPATITHDGTNIGRTSGGGSLTILEQTDNQLSDTYEVEHIPYGVEGTINLFTLNQSITITSSLELYGFGQIEITLPEGSILLYRCKILLPQSLSFGQLSQSPITIRLQGGKDSSGNLIKIN